MMPSTRYKDNVQNGIGNEHGKNKTLQRNGDEIPPEINNDMARTDYYRSTGGDLIMKTSIDDDYPPSQSRRPSSFGSFCRWCCTFQHFCYVVQFVNCGLVSCLIYLAVIEYPKIEALQAQVEEDQAQIAALTEEVREKQEGQIQSLHKAVEQEQKFNFLSLAGFFTLLTCLISMFHMTTHIHKFNQPKIQRKIISILWMSPIYSVTSFLSLIFPSVEGWMAIIKDFYESYCIYVFLSFLIAVLGEGSRDKAVEVLAKHTGHLDRPTRCLNCLYEPHPDTSDHAKANAVMTQCQIYCLQFTLVRPLTTMFSVFVLRRHRNNGEETEDYQGDDEFNDDTYNSIDNDFDGDGDIEGNNDYDNQKSSTESQVDEVSITDTTGGEDVSTVSYSDEFDPNTSDNGNTDDGGARTLHDTENKNLRLKETQIRKDRRLQEDKVGGEDQNPDEAAFNSTIQEGPPTDGGEFDHITPSITPGGDVENHSPTSQRDETSAPSILAEGILLDISTYTPTMTPNDADPLTPAFIADTEIIPEPQINSTFSFDHNMTGPDGVLDTNITIPSIMPTMSPINETSFDSSIIVDQTKAYFKSPGFAVAMVVNVSIFFAFTGLLRLYHAVRQELLWCRPFPKFLTIKAVVFLTFWQGLAILLYLVLTAGSDDKENVLEQAHKYQNLLICVEMLLVAISQWCVFPAIEWEPNYVPRQMHTPGIGLSDFVDDVGQIVKNRSGRRKGRRIARRKKRGGDNAGMYHTPGFSSIEPSKCDGLSNPAGGVRAEAFTDEFGSSDYDGSLTNDGIQSIMDSTTDTDGIARKSMYNEENPNENTIVINPGSISDTSTNRGRLHSEGTGYCPDKEITDDDLEVL